MIKKWFVALILLIMVLLSINVNANSRVLINIDFPKLLEENDGEILIQGWYVGKDANKTIEIKVNGNTIDGVISQQRDDVFDVIKEYGDNTVNSTPGFTVTYSTNQLLLGNNTLEIIIYDENNNIIGTQSKKFELENYDTIINLDYPSNKILKSAETLIQGWYLSEATNKKIEISVDGNIISTESISTYQRTDVLNAITGFGGEKTNNTPGFTTKIDTSNYSYGNHVVNIKVIDSITNQLISEISRTFEIIKPKTLVVIDYPMSTTSKDEKVNISGWVMSELKDREVNVYVNNVLIGQPTYYNRADVLNAIKGYGNEESNPTAGFSIPLDTNSLTYGKHEIKVEVIEKTTKEVIETTKKSFTIEKPDTLINIDFPTSSVVKNEDILIGGWILSETSNKKVEIYVDGKMLNNTQMIERNDVLNAVNGYGGKEYNPTPGFSNVISSKELDYGEHKVEVQVKDTITNEIIESATKMFEIEKPKTLIAIDTPITLEEKNTNTIINGWVMSDTSNKRIEIYFDDTLLTEPIYYNREDVISAIKGYGDEITNPTPGFITSIDTTKSTYGEHNITVKVFDTISNTLIEEQIKTIKIEKPATLIAIDYPSTTEEKSPYNIIRGWVLSDTLNKKIEVYVDGVLQVEPTYHKRDDVLSVIKGYGGEGKNELPGFLVDLDTTKLEVGNHSVTVKILDSITNELIKEVSKKFKVENYNSVINKIDMPTEIQGTSYSFEGLYLSEASDKTLIATINGKEIALYTNSISASINNIDNYGGINNNLNPLFNFDLDLTPLSDGINTIKFDIVDNITNQIIYTYDYKFELKKYLGIINLDSPSGTNYNKNNEIPVYGWEMSQLDNSVIKVYVDNKEISSIVSRTERPDVINAISGYGGLEVNATPGFVTYIDLKNLSDGRHTIKIELYSKLGDKINSVERIINVYDNISFGVDVSKYQTNVNWPQVKAYGIDYAFVRVGYRGYGSGLIGEDQYFKTNVIGASTSGLDVGIYFFSQAINTIEAREEANYSIDMIQSKGLNSYVNLPIVIDVEYSGAPNYSGRADNLTVQQRTDIVREFVNTVRQRGYEPMIYASKSFLYGNLDMNQLSDIDVWLAHYTAHPLENPDPFAYPTNYSGIYEYWQYTSLGYVDGINGYVDMNLGYK